MQIDTPAQTEAAQPLLLAAGLPCDDVFSRPDLTLFGIQQHGQWLTVAGIKRHGQTIALLAATRSQVDAAYQAALAHGGRSEGAPGLRPHYHAHYYGAYFRDPDGNKLCVACHEADATPTAGPDRTTT